MRRSIKLAAILSAAFLTSNALLAQQSQTAQSIQVSVTGIDQSYQIEGSTTWNYQWGGQSEAVAVFDTYFTLTVVSGTPNDNTKATAKHNALKDNKCNFWNGSALAASVTEKTSGSGQYKIVCHPKAPGSYPPKTGWTATALDPADPISIDVDAFIASESVLVKGSSVKYSFTMGDTTSSRLTDVVYTLRKDGEVVATTAPTHVVETGVDWWYASTHGPYGKSGAFSALAAGDNGMVSEILLRDNHKGNNGTGGSRGVIEPITYVLSDAGEYSLTISGVIKGNSFDATQNFTLTVNLVSIGGCL